MHWTGRGRYTGATRGGYIYNSTARAVASLVANNKTLRAAWGLAQKGTRGPSGKNSSYPEARAAPMPSSRIAQTCLRPLSVPVSPACVALASRLMPFQPCRPPDPPPLCLDPPLTPPCPAPLRVPASGCRHGSCGASLLGGQRRSRLRLPTAEARYGSVGLRRDGSCLPGLCRLHAQLRARARQRPAGMVRPASQAVLRSVASHARFSTSSLSPSAQSEWLLAAQHIHSDWGGHAQLSHALACSVPLGLSRSRR